MQNQKRGKLLDRSLLQGEAMELFRSAIRNPHTRDPYERRLLSFLRDAEMDPNTFVNTAKGKPKEAERLLIKYINNQVERADRGEISKNTIRNPLKAIKLLLEMNDVVSINWRKIRRLLPHGRDYALDRIPTNEEIMEIMEAADIRGRALTLVLLTTGIREGAISSLTVSDYSPIYRDNNLVAGKLVVYNGEPERYTAFMTVESYHALVKYLEFRRDHGEILGASSPLFRDKFDPLKGLANKSIQSATTILLLDSCLAN
ncbi:MAG: hypothetical protein ACRD8W_10725 [Nitrososphaeraceae archaeon]